MKYKALIFDLDGTLLHSIADIAVSMNSVLSEQSLPTHHEKTYQNFIGSGLKNLVRKALPQNARDEQTVEKHFARMLEVYNQNCTIKTKPYNGIIELLDQLKKTNLKLAVLSNKAHHFTQKIVAEILPNYFNIVQGLQTESTKKPNPANAQHICETLYVEPQNTLFVGDSDVDIQTAINAGMDSVGVLWGYRSKKQLLEAGANYVIGKPAELLAIL